MNRSKQLGEDSIPSLLLKFSIPAIVGMIVNALYNVVDRIFIGRGVGSLGIAGIMVSFPLMILVMAFCMLIGVGGTALVSIRLGQGKKDEAEHILGNAFVLLFIITGAISIFGLIFLDPILKVFGASDTVLPYSKAYLSIILYGAIFQGLGFGMNNFIRGEGNPKIAMITMLIGAILNTILDPLFIFVFNLGIEGAALATIISQAVSAIWVVSYFLKGNSMLKIKRENLKLDINIVKEIISIGMAPFALQLAASVLTVILNNSLKTYGGDIAISAMGIVNSILMLILMPVFGLNQGAQPIIGFNYGAKRYDRVRETLFIAIGVATGIVVLGFIATRLFSREMIALFNNKDTELIEFGSRVLKVFLTFLPLIGFQIVSSNYFQAVGKPKKAMLLSLSRQVLILIPALLILPRFFGLDGVIYAGPLSDLVSSVITAILLVYELQHLNKEHKLEEQVQ